MAVFRDASHIARVSPRVLRGISTHASCSILRLTRGGIAASGFDIDVGGGVAASAGAGGAMTDAGDGAATGTDFGMRTYISLGGFVRAARTKVIHGASG